ncbi:hypothetical protein Vretifemale_16174 [Volvox reticuliferus]|uniref:Uncharacterized protein n=1 Tax=Volvox reticuliferus TaxID=1737510 RepID=A0A8J4CSQ2_9CHLO|nr:hypothetical protein Vretifemale_16174 [Volvox reticuliferus]
MLGLIVKTALRSSQLGQEIRYAWRQSPVTATLAAGRPAAVNGASARAGGGWRRPGARGGPVRDQERDQRWRAASLECSGNRCWLEMRGSGRAAPVGVAGQPHSGAGVRMAREGQRPSETGQRA